MIKSIILVIMVLVGVGLTGGILLGVGAGLEIDAGLGVGTVFSFGLVGAFFLQGLRKILAEPPNKAVVTRFGKRQMIKVKEIVKDEKDEEVEKEREKVWFKEEGWQFFPLYPYWYGYIKVDVTKKNLDFAPQTVRTPDMGEIEIPLSITYTPDAENLIEYLNSGGESGVKNILEDIVKQKLREWAIAFDEGPQTWEEAMAAREEAIWLLAKAILGEELPRILKSDKEPSDVPTIIWAKHFYNPLKRHRYEEDEEWDKRKKEWEEYIEKIESEVGKDAKGDINESNLKLMRNQIEERKTEINSLRRGNGTKKLQHLGITLNRLNLGEFKVKGKLAEAAELWAKEKRERIAEKLELEHVQERIQELILPPFNYSQEQALEIVQTERGKVVKTVNESKWNVAPETRAMIEKIGSQIIPVIKRG